MEQQKPSPLPPPHRHARRDDDEQLQRTHVESWLNGHTITDCCEFLDEEGIRWRQLTLDDGTIIQMVLTHPWLILAPE